MRSQDYTGTVISQFHGPFSQVTPSTSMRENAVPLSQIPLHRRGAVATSPWPIANRPSMVMIPSPSRQYGTGLWRRGIDGTLDVQWAKTKVQEAKERQQNGVPLTEIDALALASVYPQQCAFDGLPPEVVTIKAFLTPQEAMTVRSAVGADENNAMMAVRLPRPLLPTW